MGRLDGLALLLPDPDWLIYSYMRKEAVLSSQIEGTQSSLPDLLLFEQGEVAPAVTIDDLRETLNDIGAMNHGLDRMAAGFPVSLRLIREVHARLVRNGRGFERDPGEFRRTQSWIGGTRPGTAVFVPPPPQEVMPAMAAFEEFLHDRGQSTSVLVRVALAHAQFGTIHPFLDGNGRVGRLLITLLPCAEGVLSRPLLYLSLYLKRHRDAYLVRLLEEDRRRIRDIGRAAGTALAVHDLAARHVMVTAQRTARDLGLARPTIYNAIASLERLGILTEVTGRARDRVFGCTRYLALLNEGID